MSADGVSEAFDARLIEAELNRARQWLAANRSGNGNRYLDYSGLRD